MDIIAHKHDIFNEKDWLPTLKTGQAAEFVGLNANTVRHLSRVSAIPCTRRRNRWYYSKAELVAWLRLQDKGGLRDDLRKNQR